MKTSQNLDSGKSQANTSQPKDWLTVGENLIRYLPSGKYYARIRTGGKLYRESLKTDVLSVAKLRLADLEKSLRQMTENQAEIARGKMTVGGTLKIIRERIQGDAALKPNTKLYYENRIKAMLKSWPELEGMDIRKLSKHDCLKWASRFARGISPTAFNNTTAILKNVCEIAIEFGARLDNPAKALERLTVKPKELELPSFAQFQKFVEAVGNGGGRRNRFSRPCATLVQFLAFGGFRKTEAENITWADVDLDKGFITVRGDTMTGTKNSEVRRVPMIDDMRTLLERLQTERPERKPSDRVMEVAECERAMTRAAKELGIKRLTHHDLRHLFATRCIESGVPIQTVSRWLGHRDGGALAMRVYGHLRDDHSAEMAHKVSFSKPQSA
ncbi:MAG TPA: site-specific integrase [Candidatus Paceibacterota bacterium]|nr:site-specific integrase [Verrucomicrobiota bacterium]HSA10445.1 site-specific integrase [Candidatus Paceibacterota bacterium]